MEGFPGMSCHFLIWHNLFTDQFEHVMMEEYENQKRKQVSLMRSILDYGMGVAFFLIGLYFLLYDVLDISIFPRKPSPMDKVIGIFFLAYGSWRLYRGYKKNYFR
jgi:hypothetical protein